MTATIIPFDNSFARLPDTFYTRMIAQPVADPGFIVTNHTLAQELQIDANVFTSPEGLSWLSGNEIPQGADPLSMVYAGHQFGGWVPRLGDGRALLLGEVVAKDGIRRDIQLKGSGPTPYSRMGDGRSALGPALREYIMSEALHALGVPTSRALAVVSTGEMVQREGPIPGGIVTRVAKSHIRVGTFQYFASRQDTKSLKDLADYVIDRHYPSARSTKNPYIAMFDYILKAQASLVAQWMGIGFIHGVMNTDNISVSGETIDYGPCAFMDTFHPGMVFSSIDHHGRYAYANQPAILQWNLLKLAECLLPLFDEDTDRAIELAQDAVNAYPDCYETAINSIWAAKIGSTSPGKETTELCVKLLDLMTEGKADFTLSFHKLKRLAQEETPADQDFLSLFENREDVKEWLSSWRQKIKSEETGNKDSASVMAAANPVIIARNHRVEEAINAVVQEGDNTPLYALLEALQSPYDENDKTRSYMKPPEPEEIVARTFCGT